MCFRALLIFLLAVFASSSAIAASVTVVQGKAGLDQGDGFQDIIGTEPVAPGDRLFAAPGGKATIIYAGGCEVSIMPPRVVSVAAEPPCKARYGVDDQGAQNDDRNYTPYVLGAAVAGGVVAAIVLSDGGDDDGGKKKTKPASP